MSESLLARGHHATIYRLIFPCLLAALLSACGGGGGSNATASDPVAAGDDPNDNPDPDPQVVAGPLDEQLAELIEQHNLIGDANFNRTLPNISDPLPSLGKQLFFSKSLGGDFDSACVSCHHPMLGGADALSLPVGVSAVDADLLGPGRVHQDAIPNVPRNSPTVFNVGIWDAGMFFDSRVESFGKEEQANGAVSDIRTPDVAFGAADPDAGPNLPNAQARFPVTSHEEMRGEIFEAGGTNQQVRDHLAARLGGYGIGAGELPTNEWLAHFQSAFGSTADAESLINYDNVALALSEYERSMTFTDNPFARYVQGDLDALTDEQKRGAILFYTSADDGGANCSACHTGDKFTDELHHTVAFPQFGHGKGDGIDDDFGRERETANSEDRYRFRTPSLLNIAVTAPYGHAGTYETLDQVVRHYDNPNNRVEDFFDDGGACGLAQFADLPNCADLYPQAEANSNAALAKLDDERDQGDAVFVNINLNNDERAELVAFLEALTDPCVLDRACMSPWIADTDTDGPDGQQLNARNADGDLL